MKDETVRRNKKNCYLCGAMNSTFIAKVDKKPERENDFGILPENYLRFIYKCRDCSVYFNLHENIEDGFYADAYNKAVYNHKLLDKYTQIINLPEEKSDNRQRVQRIVQFCDQMGLSYRNVKVLDIGSGLCVFLGVLKEFGFLCHCFDPDPIAVDHAVSNVKIKGYTGTLDDFEPEEKFDIVTFNKVLEHVNDPIGMLKKAKNMLTKSGVVYVELPDGDSALKHGNAVEREEFYIEHLMVFNKDSIEYLSRKTGYDILKVESIHEPSDKFTIYAFLKPED